ncbi:MAG: hypothetical protein HKN90_01070 [Flavobacteriaceae bacterium]|nr:hypothetical protein [Flavobacteriaceae bacterium]
MSRIVSILIVVLLFIQCKKEDQNIIAKGQLGMLTSTTQVNELEAIFAKDSVVANLGEGDFANAEYDEYQVFEKGGKHLLTLIPKEQHDTTSTIESIQIYDKRYKTVKGLNLSSTFKDIIENYTVNKVESTFSSAVLFVDELNVTIAIDKKDIGIREFGIQDVRLDQIPDLAKIKYFTLWFD